MSSIVCDYLYYFVLYYFNKVIKGLVQEVIIINNSNNELMTSVQRCKENISIRTIIDNILSKPMYITTDKNNKSIKNRMSHLKKYNE